MGVMGSMAHAIIAHVCVHPAALRLENWAEPLVVVVSLRAVCRSDHVGNQAMIIGGCQQDKSGTRNIRTWLTQFSGLMFPRAWHGKWNLCVLCECRSCLQTGLAVLSLVLRYGLPIFLVSCTRTNMPSIATGAAYSTRPGISYLWPSTTSERLQNPQDLVAVEAG